jgi:hypothetical protein
MLLASWLADGSGIGDAERTWLAQNLGKPEWCPTHADLDRVHRGLMAWANACGYTEMATAILDKAQTAVPRATSLQAIETHYKGYRFRSRLEARWAVFFETLGLTWEYEKEGMVLPSGRWYLPDFYIQELGWFEIKPLPANFEGMPWPQEGSVEEEFLTDYLLQTEDEDGTVVLDRRSILFGTPGEGKPYDPSSSYAGCSPGDSPYFFCECPYCGTIGFQFDGRSARNRHHFGCIAHTIGNGDKNYNINSPRILEACNAARAARFDRGK